MFFRLPYFPLLIQGGESLIRLARDPNSCRLSLAMAGTSDLPQTSTINLLVSVNHGYIISKILSMPLLIYLLCTGLADGWDTYHGDIAGQ